MENEQVSLDLVYESLQSPVSLGSFHLKKGGMTNGNKFCEQSVSSPHGNSKSHDFIVC